MKKKYLVIILILIILSSIIQTDAGVEYIEYEAEDTKLRYEIVAYKSLVGKQLESGMFTFELIKYGTPINVNDPFSGNVTVIGSTSNSTIITDINDPHYGMSSINFIIPIDEDGIYYYGIREIAGSDNTMPVLGQEVRLFIEQDKRLGSSGHPDRNNGGTGATWVLLK